MKQNEVPQDEGNLSKNHIREIIYATDDQGNYTTALSSGWEPKSIALSNSLEEIDERVQSALQDFKLGKSSPILYFMERNRMDLPILSSYMEMWQWRVKRHFKPEVFQKLSGKNLEKYASIFNISVDDLKNFKAE